MENVGGGSDGLAAPAGRGSRKHELVPQLQFPSGIRFLPTDEELIDVYLRSKIEGRMPPLDVVNEVDIMRCDPEILIDAYKSYGEKRWFFFTVWEPSKTKKKGEPNRKVVVDDVEEGSWSATGSVTHIHSTKEMNRKAIIGTKRVLTYRSVRSPENEKWSMHEYVMAGKSQMGQYVVCAIQLKQTYEAEKKAAEEKSSTNKRNRKAARKGRRDMQPTSQSQDQEQQETPPPVHEETTGNLEFNYAPSMPMMFPEGGGEDTLLKSLFAAPFNDGIVQAVQQENYAVQEPMLYSQEPLPFANQPTITQWQCCCGNCPHCYLRQHSQRPENASVALGQQYDRAWVQNTVVYPNYNSLIPDGNMEDHAQNQIYNQVNGAVLIEETGDSTTVHGNLMLSEQMASSSDDVAGCDYEVGQSVYDTDISLYINDFFLDGNGDGDSVVKPDGSNQTSLQGSF
uniref:NAC domain-containing protein n=1 Tax=Leersia perrieri TaxID=77586 RepID=A0A0D9XP14_9ORYZ